MRIAIVNDQEIAIAALRRVLAKSNCEIVWIAYNGAEAVEKCRRDKPDLILMNLIMPVMNGAEATSIIMKENPCAILIVTSSLDSNKDMVFEAMGYGALDVVSTPVISSSDNENSTVQFVKKLDLIAKLTGKDLTFTANNKDKKLIKSETFPIVAIGASTGGPKAILSILTQLPSQFGASVVIAQHVDSRFAHGLVEWLGSQSTLNVVIAIEGTAPQLNTVHIAGTDDHLILNAQGQFSYTKEPVDYPYRPSINEFFKSLAKNPLFTGIAVLLTGMGNDGAAGLLELKNKGWHTLAQDASTSIVYGMPKAAAAINAAIEILPLDKIANSILFHINIRK